MRRIVTTLTLIGALVALSANGAYAGWQQLTNPAYPSISPASHGALINMSFSGNRFFVISDAGALYCSTDQGGHWSPFGPESTYFEASSVVMVTRPKSQSLTPYVILTTNKGVFRSADLGATWQNLGSQELGIKRAVLAGTRLFGATDRNGLWVSADTGVTWSLAGFAGRRIETLAQDGMKILIGTDSIDGFSGTEGTAPNSYLSTDAGFTWQQYGLGSTEVYAASICAGVIATVAAGSYSEIFVTPDDYNGRVLLMPRLSRYYYAPDSNPILNAYGRVFVGTDLGVTFAGLSSVKLPSGGAVRFTYSPGLPRSATVIAMAAYDSVLYVSMSDGTLWKRHIRELNPIVSPHANSPSYSYMQYYFVDDQTAVVKFDSTPDTSVVGFMAYGIDSGLATFSIGRSSSPLLRVRDLPDALIGYIIGVYDRNGNIRLDNVLNLRRTVCCQGKRGDVSYFDKKVDLSDLSALSSYLTGATPFVRCTAMADIDVSGVVDLKDLSLMVKYLTEVSFFLPDCP